MQRRRLSRRKLDQRGFTILELLIATAVLSVILLLVTTMITGVGNLYYKGITLSQTQDMTRNIADQLTQDIKFSSVAPSLPDASINNDPNIVTKSINGTSYTFQAICAGSARYSYVLGLQQGSDANIKHILWRDTITAGAACTPAALDTDLASGSELIGGHTRLSALQVAQNSTAGSLYSVQVAVAYGDDDLLTGTGAATHCKGDAGNQFCATDSLTTSALQRITGVSN